MRELADFLKQGLSDNITGLASFARQACAGILYMMVVWETYLISKSGAWVDIPANWLILVLAIWTVAKGAEVVGKKIDQGATNAN